MKIVAADSLRTVQGHVTFVIFLMRSCIYEHVASGVGTNIGLMRDTWTDSLRV